MPVITNISKARTGVRRMLLFCGELPLGPGADLVDVRLLLVLLQVWTLGLISNFPPLSHFTMNLWVTFNVVWGGRGCHPPFQGSL